VLFNSNYWKGFLDWLKSNTLARGFISEEDLNLMVVCDQVDEVIDTVQEWHQKHQVVGRKALPG